MRSRWYFNLFGVTLCDVARIHAELHRACSVTKFILQTSATIFCRATIPTASAFCARLSTPGLEPGKVFGHLLPGGMGFRWFPEIPRHGHLFDSYHTHTLHILSELWCSCLEMCTRCRNLVDAESFEAHPISHTKSDLSKKRLML